MKKRRINQTHTSLEKCSFLFIEESSRAFFFLAKLENSCIWKKKKTKLTEKMLKQTQKWRLDNIRSPEEKGDRRQM